MVRLFKNMLISDKEYIKFDKLSCYMVRDELKSCQVLCVIKKHNWTYCLTLLNFKCVYMFSTHEGLNIFNYRQTVFSSQKYF